MQSLHDHQSGEGASKKNEHVMLMKDVLGAFESLRKPSRGPLLEFTDFSKPFLLVTDARKLGLGAVLSKKQTDGQ